MTALTSLHGEKLRARLRDPYPAYPEGRFAGRGIVVVAGGSQIFTNAYVLISILRLTLGCRLPIELWHFRNEVSEAMRASLDNLDVSFRDASAILAASGERLDDAWQLKSYALAWSGFAEVLLLDADQVPLRDPAELFDWPQFREAGAVFWPDVVDLREDCPIWELLGLPPRRQRSLESGQLLVDKRRNWVALLLAVRLNADADVVYELIYGDKDTYLLAWELAGATHALVPHQPLLDDFAFVQRDFAGAPLFQHRSNSKWLYAGKQQAVEGFRLLDECLSAIATLREAWNGRVFFPPDRDADAREAERQLAGHSFTLDLREASPVSLVLLANCEFGSGRSSDRQNWWVESREGGPILLFTDGERVTYRFTQATAEHWEGERFIGATRAVTLRQRSAPGGEPKVEAGGLVEQLLEASGLLADPMLPLPVEMFQALSRIQPDAVERLRNFATQQLNGREAVADRVLALAEAVAEKRGAAAKPVMRKNTLVMYYVRNTGEDAQ